MLSKSFQTKTVFSCKNITLNQQFIKNISVIGAGNVAYHLCKAFVSQGFKPQQVYARSKSKAAPFAKMGVEVVHNSAEIKNAELYILAVNDDSIADAAAILPAGDAIVVHTSGSMAMEILADYSPNCGVFYPLQTFSFEREVDFRPIPIFIEGANPAIESSLKKLASIISDSVVHSTHVDRRSLHLAAVYVSNFSNALFGIAHQILEENKLSFQHLAPLMRETVEKAIAKNPLSGQTGPARRNDKETIAAQLNLLNNKPEEKEIYEMLTKYIINKYHTSHNE